jgi:hypothetical protein
MDRKFLKIVSMGRRSNGKVNWKALPAEIAIVSLALWLFGCGTGAGRASTASGQSGQPASILTQPASQAVPIDRPAAFSVVASGAGQLQYQWTKSGAEIPGATAASYTLPNVSLADSGSSFQVTVSNALGSVVSNAAVLTAGPRAPAIGDLRYLLWQQIDVPGPILAGLVGTVNASSETIPDSVGTPLGLGSGLCGPGTGCGWGFSALALPQPMTGLTMEYKAGNLPDLNTDLQSIVASNTVITSLALEPAYKEYGIAWVRADHFSGFDYRLEVVSPADIQTTAAQDGANGRVVTAVSFDAQGDANLVSYGWSGDQTTAYDVKTQTVAPANVAAAASQMAGAGYAISAFGGDDTNGWVLIGLRVLGDTLPRPFDVDTALSTTQPLNPDSGYFTPVVRFVDIVNGSGYLGVQEQ